MLRDVGWKWFWSYQFICLFRQLRCLCVHPVFIRLWCPPPQKREKKKSPLIFASKGFVVQDSSPIRWMWVKRRNMFSGWVRDGETEKATVVSFSGRWCLRWFYLNCAGANSVECGYPKVNPGAALVWVLPWLQGEVAGELRGQWTQQGQASPTYEIFHSHL